MNKRGINASFLVFSLILGLILPFTLTPASVTTQEKYDPVKFNELYSTDLNFKNIVDNIRKLITDYNFTERSWIQFMELFNKISIKMGHSTLEVLDNKQLIEFRNYVENEIAHNQLIKLESNSESKTVTTMSDAQEIEISKLFVPKLYQPNSDIQSPANNGLKDVYVDLFDGAIYGYSLPGYYIVELTLVFYDEDHPTDDYNYDQLRHILYGRYTDIETLFIVAQKSNNTTKRISFIMIDCLHWAPGGSRAFDGSYSSTQTWLNSNHYTAKLTTFQKDGTSQHPKLWVNTWNHMIGENDNNPTMGDANFWLWAWGLKHGSRMEAENAEVAPGWYYAEGIRESP